MELVTNIVLLTMGLFVLVGMGAFARLSLQEGERRATRLALTIGILGSPPLFLATTLPFQVKLILSATIAATFIIGVIIFFLPIGRLPQGNDEPRTRFDERDVIFARRRLVPGSPKHETYYARRPEFKAPDDKPYKWRGMAEPTRRHFFITRRYNT